MNSTTNNSPAATPTLTRILINPRMRGGRKFLTNPQAMHAGVRACFPPDIDESQSRVLWRTDHRGEEHILYVVGPEKPTTVHLIEQAGWETRPAQTADYSRLLSSLTKGQRWHFELVANPTYSVFEKGKRGKVRAHVSSTHQLNWLYGKAEQSGFALAPRLDDAVTDQERSRWSPHDVPQVIERWTDTFHKSKPSTEDAKASSRPVKIAKARFVGTLEVTDVELLRTALTNGIGRARGYGCGLLTLAKIG